MRGSPVCLGSAGCWENPAWLWTRTLGPSGLPPGLFLLTIELILCRQKDQAMVPTHRAGGLAPRPARCAQPDIATLVPQPSPVLPGAALFSLPLGVIKHLLLVHLRHLPLS